MKEVKQIFIEKMNDQLSIKKNRQEKKFIINSSIYQLKPNKSRPNKLEIIFSIILIIYIIIVLISFLIKYLKTFPKSIYIINTNYTKVYNEKAINYLDSNFSKYKNMIPHLTNDFNNSNIPFSLEEIFNARQIYISDAKITPDYIRYIRPINETEEEKYKKIGQDNKTIIDKNIYKKRDDQYNYIEFSKLALNEKLIDNEIIEYDNKPLISIIIPSYNKKDMILKSIRSIQNQNFKNIEIIIVNDCSIDNSTFLFNYLLKTDPRIRIFHHMINMGCWRSRLDGIIYSRGKYIILFDAGDLYEDNYVLLDAYNVMEKNHIDSCKFLFRIIRTFKNITYSKVFFHARYNPKIVYETNNIRALNRKVFSFWGNIWNRLVRANIFTKALLLLNKLLLNIHKNVWDDSWFNEIINKASYSYTIFERIGYIYLQNGYGEGSPRARTIEQKSKIIKEYVGFLSFKYSFANNKEIKYSIIKKLKEYNETNHRLRLQNFREHFEVLNELLEALIKDNDISLQNITYCQKLLNESKIREKEVNKNKSI